MNPLQNVIFSGLLGVFLLAVASIPANGARDSGWSGRVARIWLWLLLPSAALFFANAIFRALVLVVLE